MNDTQIHKMDKIITKNEKDDYFYTSSIIINEKIERVWEFLVNPFYFKKILPKEFTNFKFKQKASSFLPGDEIFFYWLGVSNIQIKFVSKIETTLSKKFIYDVILDIGIFYRKTCSLYKITNNNTTLLKIILSKIPNKEYDDDNFISFIKLNPNLYVSTFENLNKLVKTSFDNLYQIESFIVNKNHNVSWDITTDFQKLSEINPKVGNNFSCRGNKFKKDSFIKCIYLDKCTFFIIKDVEQKKNKNKWVYALETIGSDVDYTKQEIQLWINKINENKSQISIIHIFKQLISKKDLDKFQNEKCEILKSIKDYINNI
jgi:hypothetical protein